MLSSVIRFCRKDRRHCSFFDDEKGQIPGTMCISYKYRRNSIDKSVKSYKNEDTKNLKTKTDVIFERITGGGIAWKKNR